MRAVNGISGHVDVNMPVTMTLDEAIKHCEEVAEEERVKECWECVRDHKQLADWLRELKAYREVISIWQGGKSYRDSLEHKTVVPYSKPEIVGRGNSWNDSEISCPNQKIT